jgi:Big-like domain-containing protein
VNQTRQRFAFPMGFLLAALTAGCGGDIGLPNEGEAANLEIVDGDEQIGQVGLALGEQVVVRVTDTQDRPVPNQDVTFTIGSGGGTVAPTTVATNSTGLAAAGWTLGPNAGNQLLRVQTPRGGSTSTLEVTFRATAVAGSGSVLVGVTGDDQTGPVSSALADSLVVKVTDALGNPVANIEVTWTVSGGGSISPASVFTDEDGLAAAERVLGPSAGAESAQAAASGLTGSPVTFSHTAVPATPTTLVLVSGNNQTGPGGFEVAEDLVVRLEDANGNGIGARAISWVVSAAAGSVNPTSATTDPNGLATTRWTLPTRVGTYTNGVSAVFSGLPPVPFTATATADMPTTIELVDGNNQSAPVGGTLPEPLIVRVTDANDNPVANVGVVWTAVGGGSVSAEGTPTNASGLAQVSRTLGLTPGPYSTTAAVGGLAGSPVTFNSTATVGPPARLAILIQPGTPTASGAAFSPAPAIQVQDAQGNPVPQGGIAVNVAITSGQTGASLDNDQPRNTNGSGRATFTGLRITGPPGNDYVLTFSAQVAGVPLTPVSSIPLTVGAGAASRLVILTQPPATVVTGAVMSPGPLVQVVDAAGNPVAGSRNIGVTLGSGPGSLSGTTSVSTGAGSTVTFSNLRITGPGTHTLLFSSGGLTSAESGDIVVTAGSPSSIVAQPGTNNQIAPAGTAVPNAPAVRVTDASGNPVPNVPVTFAITAGGGSTVPSSPASLQTGADGVAALTSWTLGATAGTNTMTATSSVGTITFNATGTGTTATTLSADPSSSTEGDLVTFSANVTSGQGTPTGQVSFRDNGAEIGQGTLDGSGVATFQTSLTAGTHPITAHYLGDGTFGPSVSTPPLDYNVASANAAPQAQADAFNMDEAATLNVSAPGVLANDDDDHDALTAVLVSGPAEHPGFILNSDGSFTYTPTPDFNDTDTFTYQANDGQANSNIATVTITVNPVNDVPSFTAGEDVEISSSSGGGFSQGQWATGISPGPPDESGQTVEFHVTTDAPIGTFLIPPAVSSDGTLTFTQLPTLVDVIVTATIVAEDSEGATSAPQTFSITIRA